MTALFKETLLDTESNVSVDEYVIDASFLPAGKGAAWSIRKYTLHGGLQEGVDVIEVEDEVSVEVVVSVLLEVTVEVVEVDEVVDV